MEPRDETCPVVLDWIANRETLYVTLTAVFSQ